MREYTVTLKGKHTPGQRGVTGWTGGGRGGGNYGHDGSAATRAPLAGTWGQMMVKHHQPLFV